MYDRRPLRQWGRGRVTLLGDAAHPMTPNLGQGGCQAIEDAVVLASALGSADGGTIEGALRAYEQQRIARTSMFVTMSRRVGALGQLDNAALVAMRNALVRTAGGRMQARQVAGLIKPVV
jgi:2-polyprenyl-6-methoxyphenol hydroxylase-like FAD-dependent oxidoreductase